MHQILLQVTNILRKNWLMCLGCFVFFSCYFILVILFKIDTDIQPHAYLAYKFAHGQGTLTPNFLFFVLVAVFAGFSKYKALHYAAAIAIIAGSITAKYLVNLFYLKKYDTNNSLTHRQTVLLSVAALFIFCLPGLNFFTGNQFFFGQLAPNVWHNSTVIFLFPFAVLLFFVFFDFLQNYRPKRILLLIILIVINALIKPSFLFTIMPAAALCTIFFNSKKKIPLFFTVSVLGVFTMSLVLVQHYFIYVAPHSNTAFCKDCEASVAVSPFDVWDYYSESIPIAFISSLLFPLLYVIISKGGILKDRMVQFAVINFIISLAVYVLLIETGGRKYYGNFGWQIITGSYLLFFTMSNKLFINNGASVNNRFLYRVLKLVYFVHVIWGVVYFFKILVVKNYQ